MTELEKRAEEYSIREIPFIECISQLDLERLVKQAYIAGATEETKLLSEHILELQKDKGRLIDENKKAKIIRELIESMQPIKFEEDRQREIAKAEAFLKE